MRAGLLAVADLMNQSDVVRVVAGVADILVRPLSSPSLSRSLARS